MGTTKFDQLRVGIFENHLGSPDGAAVPNCHRLHSCYRLRHSYFVEFRGWVQDAVNRPGIEQDCYDPHAIHLGAWDGDELQAYLRVLPFDPEVGFMLDRELSAVMNATERRALPRENAVELSRLVDRNSFSSDARPRTDGVRTVELLLKRLYHLSLERNFERFYIVVETSWLKPFARRFGLPFRIIGQPHVFPDGTETVAAVATREELEAGMRSHSQAKYDWYRDGFVP